MTSTEQRTIYRKDYKPYPFDIKETKLLFELGKQKTVVKSHLTCQAKDNAPQDMLLNGENIELLAVRIDGKALDESAYRLEDGNLIIAQLSGSFELEIESACNPKANTALMGLYVSSGHFFTQCEAEGFRRITFYPDRPDVMSTFTVTLQGDKQAFPHLLSNGNLQSSRDLDNGRHEAVWHDPFKKPCYLFALVGGDFDVREKTVKTCSGKEVLLQMYADKGNGDHSLWALDSLERALKWDESRFNLELDLDRFMVVAVRDFNMGAMENKGLNIFNSAYVFATPATSTDRDFENVEAVIGHEYFHNWTGNRVTCQDWFQLTLKEGLTVFRDQEFTADMKARGLDDKAAQSARAVKRIDDVIGVRTVQFAEDAGPIAHPIRPESYEEIGNFYTATVYEKGAEVIRMQHTLLGEEAFQEGMKEYFRRHDGQAVTCDDFVNVMEWAYQKKHPDENWDVFRRWYSQAGTPVVKVQLDYDEGQRQCRLKLSQSCPKVGIETRQEDFQKLPFHIPFKFGLLDESGKELSFKLNGETVTEALLDFKEESTEWVLEDVVSEPVPSLLRDFSAPVILEYDYSDDNLLLLAAHDSNYFARWEAVQTLFKRQALEMARQISEGSDPESLKVSPALLKVWEQNLTEANLDPAYRGCLLAWPGSRTLIETMKPKDPQAVVAAIKKIRRTLATEHQALWRKLFEDNQSSGEYSPDPISAGQRGLANMGLAMLLCAGEENAQDTVLKRFADASNMTDQLASLNALLVDGDNDVRNEALDQFYEQWKDDPLVVDKWFSLQARSPGTSLEVVRKLMEHPAFTLRNPNRARALIFGFCVGNLAQFHQKDGSAYEFWADQVLELNRLNPEVAARLARVMDNWKTYAEPYRGAMQKALERVAACDELSKNVREIIHKALDI